jgi:trimeric autotransporter adhesin
MSTKTTFKRIALVAVAALGLGMLSVAPSSARSFNTLTLGTPAANVAVVGQVSTITVPVTIASAASGDTFTVSASLVAQPVGSAQAATSPAGADLDYLNIGDAGGDWSTTPSNNTVPYVKSSGTAQAVAGSITAAWTFTPGVAGTYTFAVFLDGAVDVTATGAVKAADTVRYISITALATPAARAAITQPLAGSVATDAVGRVNGAVLKIQAQDAAGTSSRLDGSQQVLVNLPSGVSVTKLNGAASTATTQYGIVAASFDSTGAAYINVNSSTAGTYAITAGLAGSTTLSTVSVTFVTPTGISAAGSGAVGANDAAGVAATAGVSSGIYTAAGTATITRSQTSTTITAFATTTAAKVMLTVTDTDNRIFGNTGGTALAQDLVSTAATTASLATATDGSADKFPATFTITHAALALKAAVGDAVTGYTVTPQHSTVTTVPSTLAMAITGVNAAAGNAYWDTDLPASTYLVVNGGTITVKAALYNEYGVARAGAAVTARVSAGRNLQALATNLVTNIDGEVTFTVTDGASASATTFDTITFIDAANTAVTKNVTLNYVAALTATTMTTSPSATTTTALSPADLGAINTATATASTGRDTVTATLLDAAGVPVVGMPVTLTVPAGVSFHTTTPAIAYTSATGVASWSVFTTKAGTYKFTATGGGLTKDFFGKWSGSNGRVVSVKAGTTSAGSTPVTVSVTDAYGNGVSGVAVTVTATGGYFLGLPLSSAVNTNTNGEIVVAYIGSGTVTATAAETQMFHAAGFIGTTAAAGWPAGVSSASATVDSGTSDAQVAADAAAEATDAANAATDAANAAAEAADAATAAAQDAADAVAALSTQVSEMVNALKKQITALTNLVIKIQKKVRA